MSLLYILDNFNRYSLFSPGRLKIKPVFVCWLLTVLGLTIFISFSANLILFITVTLQDENEEINSQNGNHGPVKTRRLLSAPQFILPPFESTISTLEQSISNSMLHYDESSEIFKPKWFKTHTTKSSGHIILVGDSYAEQFVLWLKNYLPPRGYDLADLTHTACPFFIGGQIYGYKQVKITDCTLNTQKERLEFIQNSTPSFLILSANWYWYIEQPDFKQNPHPSWISVQNSEMNLTNMAERQMFIKNNLRETINRIIEAGHQVILIYPTPETPVDVVHQLKSAIKKSNFMDVNITKNPLTTDYNDFKLWHNNIYKILDSVSSLVLLRFYPEKLFCNTLIKGKCVTHDSKSMYYKDHNHLNIYEGAELLMRSLLPKILPSEKTKITR